MDEVALQETYRYCICPADKQLPLPEEYPICRHSVGQPLLMYLGSFFYVVGHAVVVGESLFRTMSIQAPIELAVSTYIASQIERGMAQANIQSPRINPGTNALHMALKHQRQHALIRISIRCLSAGQEQEEKESEG
jgi:hypothetical protein